MKVVNQMVDDGVPERCSTPSQYTVVPSPATAERYWVKNRLGVVVCTHTNELSAWACATGPGCARSRRTPATPTTT